MSFLANPIANISGGIHDLGKSTLGRMAETAALVYFMGPAGLELTSAGGALAGMSTAGLAGLAGGATSLLNGGNLMDAVKSGAMAYGAGSLMGGESGIDAENGPVARGGAPVVDKSTLSELAKAEAGSGQIMPQNVAQYGVNNFGQTAGLNPSFATPDVMPTATPLQAPVAQVDAVAPVQAPVAPAPAAPNYSGQNIFTGQAPLNNPIASGPIGTNPNSTSFFGGLKDKFMALPGYQQAGLGAAGLMALKGMAKNNSVAKAPDNRRLKFYGGNPYSGAGAMYETPTLAANGGIVALANGGGVKGFAGNDGSAVFVSDGSGEGTYMTPSQMASYSGDSVYAPAIAAINASAPAPAPAAPTYASFTPTQIKQYFVDNPGANVALATQQFNADPAAVAAALGAPTSMSAVLAANNTANNSAATPTGIASLPAATTTSTAPVSTTAPTSTFSNATLAAAGQSAADRANATALLNSFQNPTATQLTDFKKQPTATQNAQIQTAISAATTAYGGNNAQAQAAVAKLMDQWGINPDTVQSALGSSYTGPSVQSLYSAVDPTVASGATPAWANQGAYATPAAAMAAATAVDNKTPVVDPNAVAASLGLKGTYKTLSDVATALGLPAGNYTSMADITKAITALSVTPKAPVTPAPLAPTNIAPVQNLAPTTTVAGVNSNGYYVPATGPTTTSNGQTYTPGYISNTTNATTAPGVSGSHASVNPNGSISQAPAMPFRPLGGYGTVQAAKDAYTKAGGSLGYVNPVAQPVTTDAGTQHYLDILSGKAPASKVPYTPNGVIAAPYYSSVMGMPLNPKYEVSQPGNPNYDPKFSPSADYIGAYAPGYTGEAAPALDPKTIAFLQGKGVDVGTNPTAASASSSASTSGAPVTLPNKVTATPLTSYPGYLKGNDGKYYDLKGNLVAKDESAFNALVNEVPAANGGLMGLAAGGLGNLGGYSDGGRLLRGPGDGISDSIPATIGARNPQPARLADGEFVVPARIVSELGNGSTEAGARKLYQMMDRVQNARKKTTGKQQVAANPRAEQYLPA